MTTRSLTNPDEQSLFETALGDPDHLLRESLRSDDRRRRRRRWMIVSLSLGGIAMFTAIAALAGWLTFAAPPPESPSAPQGASTEAWVERLLGLRDHMHTAFGVGPELTLLEPDQGVAIVQQAWPQLKHADVKTGLLKTFAFSKALDAKHPKLFQVLDLGMNDADPDIRAYAASYVSEYSHVDFTDDPQGYAAWFEKFGDKTPDEVLGMEQESAERAPTASAPSTPAASDPKGQTSDASEKSKSGDRSDRLAALNSKGWQQFFGRNYPEAEATFGEILEQDPDHLPAMNGLGFSLLNQGKAKEARPYFERILALEPHSPGPLNGLGRCLQAEGKIDAAIAVWERGLKDAPGPNDISYALGLAYVEVGQFDKAIPLLQMSLEASPNDPKIKQALEQARAGN